MKKEKAVLSLVQVGREEDEATLTVRFQEPGELRDLKRRISQTVADWKHHCKIGKPEQAPKRPVLTLVTEHQAERERDNQSRQIKAGLKAPKLRLVGG